MPAAEVGQLGATLSSASDRQASAEFFGRSGVVGLCGGALPGIVDLSGVVAVLWPVP